MVFKKCSKNGDMSIIDSYTERSELFDIHKENLIEIVSNHIKRCVMSQISDLFDIIINTMIKDKDMSVLFNSKDVTFMSYNIIDGNDILNFDRLLSFPVNTEYIFHENGDVEINFPLVLGCIKINKSCITDWNKNVSKEVYKKYPKFHDYLTNYIAPIMNDLFNDYEYTNNTITSSVGNTEFRPIEFVNNKSIIMYTRFDFVTNGHVLLKAN